MQGGSGSLCLGLRCPIHTHSWFLASVGSITVTVTFSLRLVLPVIFPTYSESSDTFWKLVKNLGIIGIFKDSISLWGEGIPHQHLS